MRPPPRRKTQGDGSRFLRSVWALGTLQAANYVLPLVTVPYLFRVLRADAFGRLAFAQSLASSLVLVVEYGFQYSATAEVARVRHDRARLRLVVSNVLAAKALLVLTAALVLLCATTLSGRVASEQALFWAAFTSVVAAAVSPEWLLVGLERMRAVLVLGVVSRGLYTLAVLLLVRTRSDYVVAALTNGCAVMLVGAGLMARSLQRIGIERPTPREMKAILFKSTPFFLSRASVMTYTTLNAFLLGLTSTANAVACYAGAERLYTAISQLSQPVSTSLYPLISRTRNLVLHRRATAFTTAATTVAATVLWAAAEPVVRVFMGPGFDGAVVPVRIFCFVLLITVPSRLVGYPLLAALGHSGYANGSVMIGAVVQTTSVGVLYALRGLTVNSLVAVILLTEGTIFAIRVYGIARTGAWGSPLGGGRCVKTPRRASASGRQ
ncbi:MAG: oligosaccharide flippase family protein [Vicinamibacterales bacterium]